MPSHNANISLANVTINVASFANSSNIIVSKNITENIIITENVTTNVQSINVAGTVINVPTLNIISITKNTSTNSYSLNVVPLSGGSFVVITIPYVNTSIIIGNSGGGNSNGLPLLFSDNFESGGLTHTENGISWTSATRTFVSSNNSNGGTHSLQFVFDSNADAEQRFNLSNNYTELIFTYDLYLPNGTESYGGASYLPAVASPNNDKFIRLWRGDQTDGNDGYTSFYMKVGASTTNNLSGANISRLIQEYGVNGGGVGQFGSGSEADAGSYGSYFTTADLGTWIAVKLHFKSATAAGNNGVIEAWKNGTQVLSFSGADIYPSGGAGQNGFNFGYLLGFANSGFVSNTYMFIDNVKIYGT